MSGHKYIYWPKGEHMDKSFSIKSIKKAAVASLKRNYIACFAVCFVMVFIAGQYGGSTQFIASYDMQNVTNLRIDNTVKREIIETMKRERLTAEEASDRFNVNDVNAVKNWEMMYDEFGPNSLNAKELTFFHSGNESSNWAIIDNTVSLISGKDRPITAFVSENSRRHEQNISDAFDMVSKEYSPHFQVLNAILAFFSNMSPWEITVTCATSLFSVLVAIFAADTLIIGERRFFLENRAYRRTNIGRMGFMIKERFFKPLKTIFLMHLYRGLWFLTVFGGFYKTYEYYMIPFILAENPNIETKKAFTLSKEMMKGHKFRTFLLNASFLLWEVPIVFVSALIGMFAFGEDMRFVGGIIAYIGLGVSRIGFLNCYKTASDAELYIVLRRKAIAAGVPCCEEFCDRCLDPETLGEDDAEIETLAGRMTAADIRQNDIYPGAALQGTEYTGLTRKKIFVRHDYHRNYKLSSIVLIFFSFSTIGWLWEVVIHIIEDGELINRGALHGPWLPIYGVGGTAAVLFLKRFRDRPEYTFTIIVFASAVFEYAVSWYFEKYKGLQYWNYHGYFMNINSRICLEGVIVFGFAGIAAVYLFAPIVDDIASRIPVSIKRGICIALLLILAADVTFSFKYPNEGKGITDYAANVVELSQNVASNFIG